MGTELVPAEGTKPREECCFAAIGLELSHGFTERGLSDFFGSTLVPVHPRQCEPEEARKVDVEEAVEGRRVAHQHLVDEGFIARGHLSHRLTQRSSTVSL